MLRILTVHYRDSFWLRQQMEHLKRNVQIPYELYAFVHGVEGSLSKKMLFVSQEPIAVGSPSASHAMKLNILADIAVHEGHQDDVLWFLDSDAFPILPIEEGFFDVLEESDFVSVADERLRVRVHPCCAFTKSACWQEIRGDWKPGVGEDLDVALGDTGARIPDALLRAGKSWKKIERINSVTVDPLWFAVFQGGVYHHGAGSRRSKSLTDNEYLLRKYPVYAWLSKVRRFSNSRVSALAAKLGQKAIGRRYMADLEAIIDRNRRLSEEMRLLIQKDSSAMLSGLNNIENT